MKIYKIALSLCFGILLPMQSFGSLDFIKKDFLYHCAMQQGLSNRDICKAFAQFDELRDCDVACIEYVDAVEIKHIFQEQFFSEQIKTAQLLLVVELYDVFFKKNIIQITERLQTIIETKQYWMRVLLQESLSFFYKHPGFCKHKKLSKELIERRIEYLQALEVVQLDQLGMHLLSDHRLQKINKLDQLEIGLKEALEHVQELLSAIKMSTMSATDMSATDMSTTGLSAIDFFNIMPSLFLVVQEKQKTMDKALKRYSIPQYIDRYWYATSVLIATTFVGLAVWYKNKDKGFVYQEKVQRAMCGFLQDFLIAPLSGIKRAVWDRPDFGLKKFDLEQTPSSIWGCYTPERSIKYTLQTPLHNGNKFLEVAEEIVRGQQINYYLSAIVPIFAGLYAIYRNGRYYYNHESYFKPMRIILRDIDIFCNTLLTKIDGMSFADYGFLYVLVLQLQNYLSCLSASDRAMMEYDLKELISFDFTVQQKQNVIERMYRTYAFLK